MKNRSSSPMEIMQEATDRQLALKESRVWAWPALATVLAVVVFEIIRHS